MKTKGNKIDTWAINKVKTEYKDDVLLLIGHHNTYKLEKDAELATFSFFIPASEKAYELARTFIIDGVGYDLFPMSWERIERIVELDEDNATCVGDAEMLYYGKEEDKKRFLELQARLQDHLHNPQFMLNKALEKVNVAMELYQTMMFEEKLFKVRKAAGYILNFLITAVAYSNQTYFKNGYMNHMPELLAMKSIPGDFIRLYEAIVKANTSDELKKLCHEMIYNTRQFLSSKKGNRKNMNYNQDYKELASWYEELSYAWREIYHWCDQNDAVKAFMRGCFLQSEIDIVREEFGLEELDLLSSFRADDMTAYRKRAEALEKQIVSTIEEHGVKIDMYDSIEGFLEKNA